VSAVCRELGVSPKTFYKYLGRFRADGLEGFFPRSRAPKSSPTLTSGAVEDAIVLARKELDDRGECGDNGPISIRWRLQDQGIHPVPSRATIARVLSRRGLVVASPRKRPTSSRSRRFEMKSPNDMWHLDGFDYRLSTGATVTVVQIGDDCSRLDLADLAAPSENAADVWTLTQTAIGRYGLPRRVLTDNGSAVNGHRRGFTTALENRLRALGVTPISTSNSHPQTNGKNERGHSTLQRWLHRQPQADDLPQLQSLLNTYRPWYNNRRHQSLRGLTPQQRWDLAERTHPNGTPIPPPPMITRPTVSPRGAIGVDGVEIGLAKRHAGTTATVFRTGDHTVIFIANTHIRTLTIDRARHYQPNRIKPTGRPRSQPPAPAPGTGVNMQPNQPQTTDLDADPALVHPHQQQAGPTNQPLPMS
jgi:Integrase core domain/leucine-zipper of insertion element IS481